MRSLFALLVVGNILLAGWNALRPAPPAAASRALDVPSIELVGERLLDARRTASSWSDKSNPWDRRDASAPRTATDAAASTAAELASSAANPEATTESAASSRCLSIGPFRDDAAADVAAESLAAAGHTPSKRSAEEDFWIGYWVYIEAASAGEARDVAASMRDGGIRDAYVVSDDELGNLVSLGVFQEERRAERLRAQARAIGGEPTIVERTRRAAVTWLDIAATGTPSIDLQTLQPAESSTPLRQEICPSPDAP